VGEHYMKVSEARAYIKERYGVTWSGAWVRKLVEKGTLRGVRPGGGKGWLYVSRESIDERFQGSEPYPS
jgi:hypothetical protein